VTSSTRAVHAAVVGQERPTPPPARVVEGPKVPEDDFDLCPWCNKKHMRHLIPVTEARHHLGGISPTTFLRAGQGRRTVARQDRSALVCPGGRPRRFRQEEALWTLLVEPKLPGHPIPRKWLVAEWEDLHHRNLIKGPVASFLFDVHYSVPEKTYQWRVHFSCPVCWR